MYFIAHRSTSAGPSAIIAGMKRLISVALVALFGLAVFMPDKTTAPWLYWSLFVLMFALLGLYWYVSYWVSPAAAAQAVGEPLFYSMPCAKVPPAATEDLVRGRLVVTSTHVHLVIKTKRAGSPTSFASVWSTPICSIKSISFGKVIGMRHGMFMELEHEDVAKFVSTRAKSHKEHLIKAFGWEPTSI